MTQGIVKSTFPVLFGYIPLGIAFGMLFQDLGYPWYLATLMAFFVYAGTAQFMIVGLLAAGVGLINIGVVKIKALFAKPHMDRRINQMVAVVMVLAGVILGLSR